MRGNAVETGRVRDQALEQGRTVPATSLNEADRQTYTHTQKNSERGHSGKNTGRFCSLPVRPHKTGGRRRSKEQPTTGLEQLRGVKDRAVGELGRARRGYGHGHLDHSAITTVPPAP